ncbi:hypothetical protein KUTeg_024578 [Tegillarca granosa]|uniref:Uncharacterized protein n=1 Tax=Tegillarca granosa TaxID=220873 RepID=A0ABQ9E385_TEGGR|nr:hypothetical protein KUTeg_024578 [Tegillarca granosa]
MIKLQSQKQIWIYLHYFNCVNKELSIQIYNVWFRELRLRTAGSAKLWRGNMGENKVSVTHSLVW